MKNGKLVSAYLDYCVETSRLTNSGRVESVKEAGERILSGRAEALYQACLDDGWTRDELDAAFERRFNVRIQR